MKSVIPGRGNGSPQICKTALQLHHTVPDTFQDELQSSGEPKKLEIARDKSMRLLRPDAFRKEESSSNRDHAIASSQGHSQRWMYEQPPAQMPQNMYA